MLIALSLADPNGQDDPTLFSNVRAQYQSILEELLETNNFNVAVPDDFAARHRSGSYLCRYRSCPRAIQGFGTPDLRQEHETSHAPLFRCTDSTCGLFGRALTTRAAMNKHSNKYHGDDRLGAIPTSLRKVSARPQDRSRFLLKEPPSASRKRSFDAAKDEIAMGKVDVAIDPASDSQVRGMPGASGLAPGMFPLGRGRRPSSGPSDQADRGTLKTPQNTGLLRSSIASDDSDQGSPIAMPSPMQMSSPYFQPPHPQFNNGQRYPPDNFHPVPFDDDPFAAWLPIDI